jgi:hypothetical protein
VHMFKDTVSYVKWRMENNKGIGKIKEIRITEKRDPKSTLLATESVYPVDTEQVQKGMYSSVIFACLDRWSRESTKEKETQSYIEKLTATQNKIVTPSSFTPYAVYAVDEVNQVAYLHG